jgi:hypothetical protein
MELSPSRSVWVLLNVLLLVLGTSAAQQLSCPPMPGPVTGAYHDVHSDVQTTIGSWGKIKGADLKVQTDVVAKNIYEKYPNLDRIAVAQMMTAVYCSSVAGDNSLDRHEAQRLLAEFSERVFRFVDPDYHPFPPHPSVSQKTTPPVQSDAIHGLLNDIEQFSRNKPLSASSYGWGQYVADVDTLYRRAMDFYDLLGRSSPRYADVSLVYAALDEAGDELSMRGRLMHDSGMVSNDNYDRHIFVGPGWFRVSLQALRRAHEEQISLDKKYVDAFGSDVEYWKLCWSGTAQNTSNCK